MSKYLIRENYTDLGKQVYDRIKEIWDDRDFIVGTMNDLKTEEYDAIILTLYNDLYILPHVEKAIKESKNKNKDIYPIMTPTISYLFKKLFEKTEIK